MRISDWSSDVCSSDLTAATLAPDQPRPADADLVWTVQNYHDIANDGGADALTAFDKRVFAALKPGGIYVVIDHAAAAGPGLRDTDTLHRTDPPIVKQQVAPPALESPAARPRPTHPPAQPTPHNKTSTT